MELDAKLVALDRWYSINREGVVLVAGGGRKESVDNEEAHYFIRRKCIKNEYSYNLYEHIIFEKNNEQTTLGYNGLSCIKIYDYSYLWKGAWNNWVMTKVEIKDRLGMTDTIELHCDLNLYSNILLLMKTLDKYSGWEELNYFLDNERMIHKIKELELELSKLREITDENQFLKDELEKYSNVKNSILKLFHTSN